MVPPRSMARGDSIWLRSLSAILPGGRAMGCKLIAASPRARCASCLISLFDPQTMALAALIDGNRVTGLRTAATAAVAIDALAPQRPLHVGVIGAGFEAQGALACLAAVRPVASVRVFSPTPASRERFAAGVDIAAKLVSLADLLAGRITARRSPGGIVLYKSVGSALQDIVVAEMLHTRARQLGRGTVLPISIVPVAK